MTLLLGNDDAQEYVTSEDLNREGGMLHDDSGARKRHKQFIHSHGTYGSAADHTH